jgi:sarcosine oxidase gamma subunit
VLVMSADGLRNGASTAADSDGAFRFQGLAPGKYFVVAIDGADGLDLSNSGTLAKLQSLATEVDVQASAAVNVRLELKSLEP